jgi:hypothetical protein
MLYLVKERNLMPFYTRQHRRHHRDQQRRRRRQLLQDTLRCMNKEKLLWVAKLPRCTLHTLIQLCCIGAFQQLDYRDVEQMCQQVNQNTQ